MRVIRDALEPYGEDAATVEHVWSDEAEMWFAGISQANRDAATFPAAFDGVDLVSITIGEEVWFEVFPVRRPGDLDYIGEPAAAVFAGRVEEVRGGGFAQIILGHGSRVPVGTTHLPRPWKWCGLLGDDVSAAGWPCAAHRPRWRPVGAQAAQARSPRRGGRRAHRVRGPPGRRAKALT